MANAEVPEALRTPEQRTPTMMMVVVVVVVVVVVALSWSLSPWRHYSPQVRTLSKNQNMFILFQMRYIYISNKSAPKIEIVA